MIKVKKKCGMSGFINKSTKLILYFTVALVLAAILFFICKTTEAEQNPPPPNGGETTNDWIIENGDDILRENQEIRLKNCNLIIENEGKLTFRNITLKTLGRPILFGKAQYQIEVQSGGEFYIYDSVLTDNDNDLDGISGLWLQQNFRFFIYAMEGAKMELINSELYECGDFTDDTHYANDGFVVESDDVIIQGNYFSNNFVGISCKMSSPIIENNTFDTNWYGIKCENSSPVIKNNIFYNNTYGLSIPYNSKQTISKMVNNIANGIDVKNIYIHNKSNTIIENQILDGGYSKGFLGSPSKQGIITLYDCVDVTIKNCNINNNYRGIYSYYSNFTVIDCFIQETENAIVIEKYSKLTATNVNIFNNHIGIYCNESATITNFNITNNNVGIYSQNSNPVIENNYIADNKWYGIQCSKSSPLINGNTISNNGEYGIYCFLSSSKISRNKIFNHKNIGIYSHNATTIIDENTIYDNNNGIFCDLGLIDIINNEIFNNTNGIYSNYSSPKISNNKIFNNKYGILSYSYSQPIIIENVIFNNTYGIFSNSSSFFDIFDCEITNNDYGIYVSKTSSLTMKNNIISDNRIRGMFIGEYSFTIWEINKKSTIRNNTISLRGETVILRGANLIFSNSTIIMKLSSNSIIDVMDGGTLNINNTNITSNKPSRRFKFRVQNGGKLEMKNSNLSYCGYDEFYTGLTIESDDVVLENNNFTNNYYGIYCYYSSPIIKNNSFSENKKYGIYCFYSNAVIENNIIFNNSNGIMISSSNPYIKNNQILENKENGIVIFSEDSKLEIFNCRISKNGIGIYTDFQASPTLINCTGSDDLYLDSTSQIVTINTTFNKVYLRDSNSTLIARWFLHLRAIYPNENPVPNAKVHIQEQEFDKRYNTGQNGLKKWILLTEYSKKYNSIKQYLYTFNLSDDKIYNVSQHGIDKTMWLTLILEDIVLPQIFDVNVSGITENSALISWKTNEKCDSTIKYGKNSSYGLTEEIDQLVFHHNILLKDLEDKTVYNFTVHSKDENGNSKTSDDYSFETKMDLIPPDPIKNLKAEDTKKGGEIKLTWNECSANDFSRYNIYRVDQEIMIIISTVNDKTKTTFFVNGLTNLKKYYFAVTAQDRRGNENKSAEIVEAVPTLVEIEIDLEVAVINTDFQKKVMKGEEIKITAIIENIGNETINDIVLEFYFGEKFIGEKDPSIILEKGESTEVYLFWDAEKGKEKIKIILKDSTNETIGEIYESEEWLEVVIKESSVNYGFLLIIFLLIIIAIVVITVPKKKNKRVKIKGNNKTDSKKLK